MRLQDPTASPVFLSVACSQPPVFLSKSAQAVENKGSEREKERQERLRVRKLLRSEGLRRRRGNLVGLRGAGAKTHLLQGKRKGEPGTRQQNLDYRLPYPLLFVK